MKPTRLLHMYIRGHVRVCDGRYGNNNVDDLGYPS